MPAERFYIDADLTGLLTLTGPEHHHLIHVMRIRVGEKVELVNGRGSLAIAKLTSLSKQEAALEILSSTTASLFPRLTLAVPFMRLSKLELVIEKCTELGASAFFLYPAHHSEKTDLSVHQQERLKHIAISAMKQCGRLDLPSIHLGSFNEFFALSGILLFGDAGANEGPKQIEGELSLITGPEKGFSEKELNLLKQKAMGVRLHKNILRAETAPIAAAVIYA